MKRYPYNFEINYTWRDLKWVFDQPDTYVLYIKDKILLYSDIYDNVAHAHAYFFDAKVTPHRTHRVKQVVQAVCNRYKVDMEVTVPDHPGVFRWVESLGFTYIDTLRNEFNFKRGGKIDGHLFRIYF